jgi:uncharacterized Zn finger protein
MDASIITQTDEERKRRAYHICEQDGVRANGGNQYSVRSQSHPDTRYNVTYAPDTSGRPQGTCNCPDATYNGNTSCKHILAASIYHAAELKARLMGEMYGPTALLTHLQTQLDHSYPSRTVEQKLKILLLAAQRIVDARAAQPAELPEEIVLRVRYVTQGTRIVHGTGVIEAVIEDGLERKPKIYKVAWIKQWLTAHHYTQQADEEITHDARNCYREETFVATPAG